MGHISPGRAPNPRDTSWCLAVLMYITLGRLKYFYVDFQPLSQSEKGCLLLAHDAFRSLIVLQFCLVFLNQRNSF